MRNKIALFAVVACMATGLAFAETDGNGKQSSAGDKSPVINAGGNATVNYGMDEKQFSALLKAQEERIVSQLKEPGKAGDEKERLLLERQLKDVQEKLADLEKSYKEKLQLLQETVSELDKVKGKFPEAMLEKAKSSALQGNTEEMERLFDSVDEKSGRSAAQAAFQSGRLAEDRLDYAKALRKYNQAVTLEENNPKYLNAAGKIALTMGEYRQAEDWFTRFLKIMEQRKDGAGLGAALNGLALMYKEQGRYAEAEPLYKRSLEIAEKIFGKDHRLVATSLHNLAGLYGTQGRYEEAEPLCKRSLEIREQKLGKNHPDVASSLNSLALMYEKQGRYSEAEPLYKRSLEIREQKLGKNHPDVATTLNNLAKLYYQQGSYAEAEPLYQRALMIWGKTLGKNHPHFAFGLNNLAEVYQAQGRYAEAEPLYQQCLSILKTKFPGGHPRIDRYQKNYDELKRKMAEQK